MEDNDTNSNTDSPEIFLTKQIWNGPKIAKYGQKYLGIYDLQVADNNDGKYGDLEFLAMQNAFNEISRNLRYNEFRRLLWKGQTECYQFIKPLSTNQAKAYTKGSDNLKMTTSDILEYARSRVEKQTSQIVSGNQVKNRSVRESKWKKWYQKRLDEEAGIENKKIEFLKEHVIPITLKTGAKLLDFQTEHVKILLGCLNNKGVALDASDTGTGKTYAALCLAKEMGLMPIIVCPKSIIPGWKRAMSHFGIGDYYVANYEQYRAGNTPYLTKKNDFDLSKYKSKTYKLQPSNPEDEDNASNGSSESSNSPMISPGTSPSKFEIMGGSSPQKSLGGNWGLNKFEIERNKAIAEKHQKETASRIPKVEYEWKLDAKKHFLIFDECHKCKNTSTLNYAIFWWARQVHEDEGLKILCLSATVADKISNAYAICLMLGLISNHIRGINGEESGGTSIANDPDQDEFNNKFNNTYNVDLESGLLKDFGYEVTSNGFYRFNQSYADIKEKLQKEDTNLKKLHNDLFPMNGSRMVISDLGDAFPENFIQAQTYDMDRRTDQIQRIYQDMEDNLAALQLKGLQAKRAELERLEGYDITKLKEVEFDKLMTLRKSAKDVDEKIKRLQSNQQVHKALDEVGEVDESTMNHLAVMMKARQRVELLKADTMIELGYEFLEQGKSVVIFVNFIETLDYCHKQFQLRFKAEKDHQGIKNSGISIIRGGQTNRQEQIDLFQENKNRLALITMGSGRESISLHDLGGHNPRVSLISPSFSAQDLVQALGRIHRAEGKSKCLQYLIFCAGTIEDRICELVQTKIHNINTINDGDLSAGLIIR